MILERHSAEVEYSGYVVIKRFNDPAAAEREALWSYRHPDIACPILEHSGNTIVMPRLVTVADDPSWNPIEELRSLLTDLAAGGVHHRDVSVTNVVRDWNGNVRLIDWECAIEHESTKSYDLYGPEVSGVPSTDINDPSGPMWWDADHRWAPGKWWK